MEWWEPVVLAAGMVVGWRLGRLVTGRRAARRQRAEQAAALLRTMDRSEQRVWLAEDIWEQRCSCGRWGLPREQMVIVDDEYRHEMERCQPEREVVE